LGIVFCSQKAVNEKVEGLGKFRRQGHARERVVRDTTNPAKEAIEKGVVF